MRSELLQRARKGKSGAEKLSLLREELHHVILQEIDRKGGFRDLCFLGGTALRILYGLDRFSEDLDFSVAERSRGKFSLKALAAALEVSLSSLNLGAAIKKLKVEQNVHSCFVTFEGLLYELDRSFRDTQMLAIKIDVDTRPPEGGVEMMSPVTGARLYKVRHYDLPSLFAGKLHAVLCRSYTKGRDLYDFLWFVGRKTRVNYVLFDNAMKQTEGMKSVFTEQSLRESLLKKFEQIDFDAAKHDVSPFLLDPGAIDLYDRDLFLEAVKKVSFESLITSKSISP